MTKKVVKYYMFDFLEIYKLEDIKILWGTKNFY